MSASAEGLFRKTLSGDDTVTESDDTVAYVKARGVSSSVSPVEVISARDLRTKHWFIKIGAQTLEAQYPGSGGGGTMKFLSVDNAESFLGWMSNQTTPPTTLGPATLSLSGRAPTKSDYQSAIINVGVLNAAGNGC